MGEVFASSPYEGASIRPSVQNLATARIPARITSVRTGMVRTDAHQPQTRTATTIRTDGRIKHPKRAGRGNLAVSAVVPLREAAIAGVTVRLVEGKAKVEGRPISSCSPACARADARSSRS